MLTISFVRLRPWRNKDQKELATQANHYEIWRNLTDSFPYPYTQNDAEAWIELNLYQKPAENLAIVVNGKIAGGIGLVKKTGNWEKTAEIGYWLGAEFWGRGIGTKAVKKFTQYVFDTFPAIHRLEANVIAYNMASKRVLEKSGFSLEGVMKERFLKSEQLYDIWHYAKLRKHKNARKVQFQLSKRENS